MARRRRCKERESGRVGEIELSGRIFLSDIFLLDLATNRKMSDRKMRNTFSC